ncbi:hypothetical protein AK812_SmicGene8488 [Symbiodinium microadriaticum]|uniref:Uncharacterized protein n=1 Tax=Symbiodinium microadriaticum TaxID=2951 RepID=A0A1Q9EKS4_SYMMI|nr:hypothetical protein AK812_SmicGene8488 [Symbiodinium microadriaticum]
MAYRGTVNSRTNQRWMLAEQASQFSSGEHSKAGAGPMLPPLSSQGAVQASKTPSGRSRDAVTSPQPSMTKATSAPALLKQPTATKRLPPPPPPQATSEQSMW